MSDYRGCRIIQCFLVQSNMVTLPHNVVGLERMSDYRGSTVCLYAGLGSCILHMRIITMHYAHAHTKINTYAHTVHTYVCMCTVYNRFICLLPTDYMDRPPSKCDLRTLKDTIA